MEKYREIGAFDAKTRLSELLRQAEQGQHFVILRHGKPVARLVPPEAENRPAALREAFAALDRIRASVKGPVNVRELIAEGRRD